MMLADGQVVGDGSWELNILITDLNVQRTQRVRGDMHIGGVMLRLVEDLDVTRDWSDHALWWPKRNKWLKHTRSTLDQCGVSSESLLFFTPMHKVARVQLPDLQFVDARLDFSVPVFNAVVQLCRDLAIRYPEELSFKRHLDAESLRKCGPASDRRGSLTAATGIGKDKRRLEQQHSRSAYDISAPTPPAYHVDTPPAYGVPQAAPLSSGLRPPNSPGHAHPMNSLPVHQAHTPLTGGGTLPGRSPGSANYYATWNGTLGSTLGHNASWEGVMDYDQNLANSPRMPSRDTVEAMFRPKNLSQKANINRGWLDSSRSLLEQGILEFDTILLRFKFMAFFDLNPKYDPVRLNQIFEQSKWSLLLEEIDCTEEEMFMFAALQLQVQLQAALPQTNGHANGGGQVDEVEAALDDLEITLEGTSITKQGDITAIPELADYLRFMKPKKITWKGWKRCYFTFKDLYIAWYRNASESRGVPLGKFCLKGCEVTPDVNLAQSKFTIRLMVPSAEGMTEYLLRCDSEQQYAKWMAGCRLGARGKTMADASYPAEVESLRKLLDLQHPAPAPAVHTAVPQDLNPEDFIAQRYLKKFKSRQQTVQRILEAHANVKDLALGDAKLQYVKAWSSLPEFGIHYFVVKFKTSKKPELMGVAYNRLMRMNLDTGESLKTWRFNTMNKWHVNWEIKRMLVQFEEEDLEFAVLSADCKVCHEFIGGYIFLSMRSKDQNQVLNEDLFHKLTGGRLM